MLTRAQRSNRRKLCIMAALVLLAAAAYMTVDVNFGNAKLLAYSMRIRAPKLIVMLITAFAIGGASLVFQSIINNTIVTPCLLGMNSLYTLIHTAVVFCVGSGSVLAANANAAFAIDLVLMGITATLIYSYLFKKTKHNVLYVLLVGTVLTSFFSSVQSTMTRVMDPNEYDTLLTTLGGELQQCQRRDHHLRAGGAGGGDLLSAQGACAAGRVDAGQGNRRSTSAWITTAASAACCWA